MGAPAGRSTSFGDAYFALGPIGWRRAKEMRDLACCWCTVCISFSTVWIRVSWLGQGVVRAGLGILPYTIIMGQNRSRPMVALTAFTAICVGTFV